MSRLILSLCVMFPVLAFGAGSSSGFSPTPTSQSPTATPPATPAKPVHQGITPPSPPPIHPLPPKPTLPVMAEPFNMPGVIGWENEKWVGTDFLGFLSKNITIDIELLKAKDVPSTIDKSMLESLAKEIFRKENLEPETDVKEGPPLPFLHVLITVYPVAKDRFVILCAPRLFEQVQVIRKDFIPSGYWQAITWEGLDIQLADQSQLDAKIKGMLETAVSGFAKRYWTYNLDKTWKSK
ncbi:MAG: hypothetical protein WCG42_09400 [Parachlamydiaceae bacterium]